MIGQSIVATTCKKNKKQKREFDISNYKQRHIAIRLMYDGREFAGFAAQDESGNHKRDNGKRSRPKKNQFNELLSSSTSGGGNSHSRLETVEKHLAFALGKTKLFVPKKSTSSSKGEGAEEDGGDPVCLEGDNGLPRLVSASGYSRCGRTDRGVSALGQVRELIYSYSPHLQYISWFDSLHI